MNALVPTSVLNAAQLQQRISACWDDDLVRQLTDYIAVPAKSPMFDPEWVQHGFIERVVQSAADWVRSQKVAGLQLEIVRLPGRTPLLFFEVAAHSGASNNIASSACCTSASEQNDTTHPETVLIYGHLDKQPEFTGWRSDLGPWTPVYEDGMLYGRGGADDGYAVYAAITAIAAIQAQGAGHPRIVGLIETSEESGSPDLGPYIDALRPRLGDVSLVVCLDSGAGNYDQLWITNSLRGNVTGVLRVEVLTEGVHSGDASGVVPSSFRVLRHVLDRLEDSASGRLLPASLHCEVPADRLAEARATAAILGDELFKRFPWAHANCTGSGPSVLPTATEPLQALLARTWAPTLSVTGVEGLPDLQNAGNVLRPATSFKLSVRLPPLVDAAQAVQQLKTLLEENAPYQARVTFEHAEGASGWNAPSTAPWLHAALQQASQNCFGAPYATIGQGGTIPLMNMLEKSFPKAQMMVCGVLGPKSNAHGPNEFLHVPYAKKLTATVAQVLAAAGAAREIKYY
ncbi:MAG: peptidase M20 [Comamonadaceae bacterium CG1_02_60_18]|nr:MAG: peptidase M20 [Comamonadaceae bacterium CG1_02_60_18]PIQ56413.1 MAG: peptidase M20 [Comamonadaceae bacterium CG12_big_fil_rev_8_21_14_0_65_59_15]